MPTFCLQISVLIHILLPVLPKLRAQAFRMELYLISTNPQNTSLLSANGVVHYLVETSRSSSGTRLTSILRPAASPEDCVIAEIEWRHSSSATVIRSPMLVVANDSGDTDAKSGEGLGAGIKLMRYLYRRNRFSSCVLRFGCQENNFLTKTVFAERAISSPTTKLNTAGR